MMRTTNTLIALAVTVLSAAALTGCVIIVGDTDSPWDHSGGHGHSHAEATEQHQSKSDGEWTVLFDGTSTEAFRGFKQEAVPAGWQIEAGALTRVDAGGDIITREQFASFELVFQWRVDPGANSGVMFHVTEDHGATYETGAEYQILDNAGHANGLDPRTSAAANYALHAPPEDYTNPAGEWNHGRLLVDGPHVEHWLNGHKVVEYELWGEDWKQLVAASKFDSMPDYGTRKRGHIAFQDHGDRVAYRDVKIRSID